VVKAPVPTKKVVAVRGDDRPGQKKTEPAPTGRFGDKPGARRNDGPPGRRGADAAGPRRGTDAPRGRDAFEPRGPRLGDAAFRAQRHALEQADNALRRLAMQAHGETLVHLMSAWEQRQAEQLPAAKELGSRVSAAQRQAWGQALQTAPQGAADTALLRLEMAAEVPTPAAHVDARRALQLQLLTKRHDAPPAQTWAQDVASVLAAPFEAEAARRVQAALKVLLKR
jgi:ATP-dependent RNA helicase SUPV3L1/SUV3